MWRLFLYLVKFQFLTQEYESKLQAKEAQYNAEAADKVKLMNEIQNLKAYYESRIQNLDEYVHKETKKSDGTLLILALVFLSSWANG